MGTSAEFDLETTSDLDAGSCPICFRAIPDGQKLCRPCFGNLPAAPERFDVARTGPDAGPGEALAMAARFMVLDREAVLETANNPRYAAIGAVVTGLGIAGSLAPGVFGVSSLVALTLFKYLAIYIPAVLISQGLARLVGGKGTYGQLFRAFNITNLAYAVGLVPVVGPTLLSVVALWDLVVSTFVLMVVHGISAPRAIWVQAATIVALVGAVAAFPVLGI